MEPHDWEHTFYIRKIDESVSFVRISAVTQLFLELAIMVFSLRVQPRSLYFVISTNIMCRSEDSATHACELTLIIICRSRLLNGNRFTGILPPELGSLSGLNRIQIDENQISGPIPPEFAGLTSIQHL